MSRRLTGVELLEEVQWLLDGGVHPLMVCQVLDKKVDAIIATATRYDRVDLRKPFANVRSQEKVRRQQRTAA